MIFAQKQNVFFSTTKTGYIVSLTVESPETKLCVREKVQPIKNDVINDIRVV